MISDAAPCYRLPPRVDRLVRTLVPCVCPPDVLELGLEPEIITQVEASMAALAPMARRSLLAGLLLYDLSALLYAGRRASELDPQRAQRLFARWWHGTALQRELAKAIKGLLCLACYELPAMQARIGYAPEPWIAAARVYRLRTYAAAIDRHESALRQRDPMPHRPPIPS